ncbi:MAG: ATP-binding cassette domain-containing protein, partial [Acidimicrobiia bacterium]|nr:ATP-binding cassette domain-containing protein [Acidimicrobiia bacterium]
MSTTPILQLDSVSRAFGGLVAVNECSFSVAPGELVGVVGPNGAGKSTVFNLATGYLPPTEGIITYKGESTASRHPSVLAKDGIARTFQTPVTFTDLTVIDNVLVSVRDQNPLRRALTGGWRQEVNKTREEALAVLERVGLADRAETEAASLSGGELRMMEIARQLLARPELLMLDEPTAGVSPQLQERLSHLITETHAEGVTVVVVEHNLRFLLDLVDRVICLAHGSVIADGTPEEIRNDPDVLAAYLGKDVKLEESTDKELVTATTEVSEGTKTDSRLEITDLESGYGKVTVLHGLSLRIAPGEIVAVLGPNGAGKSTLLRTIAGHLPPSAGALTFEGTDMTGADAHQRALQGVGYVPQERSVFATLSVIENLNSATLSRSTADGAVDAVLHRFPRLADRRLQQAATLSGGERQMLAVGSVMVGDPRLILLDEPTAGLAPRFVDEIVSWMSQITETGCS